MRVAILLFALLGIVTLCSVQFVDQYEQTGPEILKNDWVIPKRDKAFVKNEGGISFLHSQDNKKSVSIYQKVERPGLSHFVSLKADMMCQEIIPGEKSSNKGLFFLIQYDASGKSLKTDRIVTMMDGSREWGRYQKAFQISPEARVFKVSAQLYRCTGRLQLKNVSLTPVTETLVYPWIKTMILGAWGLFFISLFRSYRIEGKFWGKLFFVMCYGGILLATTIPDDLRESLLNYIGIRGDMLDLTFIQVSGLKPDEIGHLLAFALFGAGLVLFVPELSLFAIGMNVCMLAGGTELVQVLIDSRSPKVFDFCIDSLGGIMGILLAWLFRMGTNRRV